MAKAADFYLESLVKPSSPFPFSSLFFMIIIINLTNLISLLSGACRKQQAVQLVDPFECFYCLLSSCDVIHLTLFYFRMESTEIDPSLLRKLKALSKKAKKKEAKYRVSLFSFHFMPYSLLQFKPSSSSDSDSDSEDKDSHFAKLQKEYERKLKKMQSKLKDYEKKISPDAPPLSKSKVSATEPQIKPTNATNLLDSALTRARVLSVLDSLHLSPSSREDFSDLYKSGIFFFNHSANYILGPACREKWNSIVFEKSVLIMEELEKAFKCFETFYERTQLGRFDPFTLIKGFWHVRYVCKSFSICFFCFLSFSSSDCPSPFTFFFSCSFFSPFFPIFSSIVSFYFIFLFLYLSKDNPGKYFYIATFLLGLNIQMEASGAFFALFVVLIWVIITKKIASLIFHIIP